MSNFELLRRVAADLQRHEQRFCLVGALAVGAWCVERSTKDVDFTVLVPGDAEAEELVRLLRGEGYTDRAHLDHVPSGRLATVRLRHPGAATPDPTVDLLFCATGIEEEIVEAAQPISFGNTRIPVASLGHLVAMKVLSAGPGRPQDEIDLMSLLPEASQLDIEEATEALNLMATRGFTNDKDLLDELHRYQELSREQGPDLGR